MPHISDNVVYFLMIVFVAILASVLGIIQNYAYIEKRRKNVS